MQLTINDPASLMLVTRLQKEIGELMVSNAFLDEYCNVFQATIKERDDAIIILNDKVLAYDNRVQELLNEINILKSTLNKPRAARHKESQPT